MKREAKILQNCLDGHSRSNMHFHLSLMIPYGMFQRADAAVFSPELQQQLEPTFTDAKHPPKR